MITINKNIFYSEYKLNVVIPKIRHINKKFYKFWNENERFDGVYFYQWMNTIVFIHHWVNQGMYYRLEL